MSKLVVAIFFLLVLVNCKTPGKTRSASLPAVPADLLGDFKDDYGISYTINDSEWIQHPGIKYHLLKYDNKGPCFIAKNDDNNPSEAGLYTRIDIMYFSNMEPWRWGFCLTEYKAKTFAEAVSKQTADRNNPKQGCGGFPFSRMKKESK